MVRHNVDGDCKCTDHNDQNSRKLRELTKENANLDNNLETHAKLATKLPIDVHDVTVAYHPSRCWDCRLTLTSPVRSHHRPNGRASTIKAILGLVPLVNGSCRFSGIRRPAQRVGGIAATRGVGGPVSACSMSC